MRDQMQELQARSLQDDQAIADERLACEANQLLIAEVDTEKKDNQQLKEQVALLQHAESVLETQVADLNHERGELQNIAKDHERQLRESEQRIKKLNALLGGVEENLRSSCVEVEGLERRYLEQELQFCRYRASTQAHFTDTDERLQHTSNQTEAKDLENDSFGQSVAELSIELESMHTKNGHLQTKVSQHDSAMRAIQQEQDNAAEKMSMTQSVLRSAEESILGLETENQELSDKLEETCTDLRASKEAEQTLASQCAGLRQQLDQLREAKTTSEEQLQQSKRDSTASLDDVNARLMLSEDARKELQASLRQMETAHKLQIEHHEQKSTAKFESLAAQSQKEQEKLKLKHLTEMETQKRDAEASIANIRLSANKIEQQAKARMSVMATETDGRSVASGPSTGIVLVPNTQEVEQNVQLSQHAQPGKARKKVDRHTNSITIVTSSGFPRPSMTEDGSVVDRVSSARLSEGIESQTGNSEDEYENELGTVAPRQDQKKQLLPMSCDSDVVPETQDFEDGQRVAAHFKIVESQVVASDEPDHEDDLTDLSTIPSEDLYEMLLDLNETHDRQHSLKNASSPVLEHCTSGHFADGVHSDAQSTTSQGRPRSRANTASRMMPLHSQDVQRPQTNTNPHNKSYTGTKRSLRGDDNDFTDFTHRNNANSKRTFGRHSDYDINGDNIHKGTAAVEENSSHKKLRTSAQASIRRPSSISTSYAPYTPTPTPTSISAQSNNNTSPARVHGRRSSHRRSSKAGVHTGGASRLPSTRNTRSKSTMLLPHIDVHD